jgi:energy-coupling factor transporter ATP-binding protein EcfA2
VRIKSIKVENQAPVQRFEVEDLSDLVVIAGPNGVGKTRLITTLLNAFRGSYSGVQMVIEATNPDEQAALGGRQLTIDSPQTLQLVTTILQTNKLRRNYRSGVLYFESSRTIQKIAPFTFTFDYDDPYVEAVSWDLPMQGLAGRWQDTQHAIFKKIQNQKTSIANRAIELQGQGHKSMNLQFTDPLDPFRDAFRKLLGPKELAKADLPGQSLIYSEDGEERPINTLSSGEREVLNVTFDFILRNPNDCIVFFDEPEIHLHPELLTRMVATLRSIGRNNQFFFLSHSPDLVSSSLEDSVVFLTPRREDGSNQAILVKPGDEATKAMHQLGHSVGVLSLGRKIVVIEGTDASLDKRTYGQILANRFPDLVLVPGGGRRTVENFGHLVSSVLDKSVWGVEFFMLTDRDAGQVTQSDRIAQLSRYHLENYFLDGDVLAACFATIEDDSSWLRKPLEIERVLRELAAQKIGYAVALRVAHSIRQQCGNVDIMPSGAHELDKEALVSAILERAAAERSRATEGLEVAGIEQLIRTTYDQFLGSITDGSQTWKSDVPGKPILKAFCSRANMQLGRLKNLYLKAAEANGSHTFDDLVDIFKKFSEAT